MIPIRNNIYLHFSVSNCLTLDSETIDSVLPLQVRPSPVDPGLHLQRYDPLVLLHIASALQLDFPSAHSFTSVKFMAINSIGKTPKHMTDFIISRVEICVFSFHSLVRSIKLGIPSRLPSQVRPSPKYPGLHEQLKEPLVLLQTAFSLQSRVPEAQSSISENNLS